MDPTTKDPNASAYPPRLAARERQLIATRRQVAGTSTDATADPGTGLPPDTVGLALSGGGIRSATFCLGVLQALARQRLLRHIDFLSTVSGGGYCGGFLGAMMSRDAWGGTRQRQGVLGAEEELADRDSCIVQWLRENGRYLSPNGAGDELLALAGLLRNWAAVQAVLFTFVLAILALMVLLRLLLERCGVGANEGVIWWSPFWFLPLGFLFLATPVAWAYWMVPRLVPKTGEPISRGPLYRSLFLAGVLIACACWYAGADGDKAWWLFILFLATAMLLIAAALLLAALWYSRPRAQDGDPRNDRRVRNRLTAIVATLLELAGVTAALALVDSLGETVHIWLRSPSGAFDMLGRALGAIGLGGAAAAIRALVSFSQRTNGKGRVPLPLGLLAGAAAVLVAGVVLVGLDAGAHAVARDALLWPGEASLQAQLLSVGVLFVLSALLSYLFGATLRFANDSSQQALYGARLARAYLGASNPARVARTGDAARVTDPMPKDDFALDGYMPHASGGPLHLINVTLNETVAGESQVEHRDRKGLALAVGPAGLSAGVRHHALWGRARDAETPVSTDRVTPIAPTDGYRIFVVVKPPPPDAVRPDLAAAPAAGAPEQMVEPLSLSTWIAVSGAAVAPGLGARTSLGFSLLLTLFNVRLGYWWDSNINAAARRALTLGDARVPVGQRIGEFVAWLFPVQTYLFYELLARFYGPNRQHWYLSDGGHFENTAAYELIRRRVPFIIVCDCGADPDFDFADVANLVRKARTDFDAEIRFLGREDLAGVVDDRLRHRFGVPADFDRLFPPEGEEAKPPPTGDPNAPRPCAMLARVDYGDVGDRPAQPGTVILFLKPSLVGDEPADVLHYAGEHPDFPHESTGDQYFDEAQWESYRKLGEHIGSAVFVDLTVLGGKPSLWAPRSLRQPVIPRPPAP